MPMTALDLWNIKPRRNKKIYINETLQIFSSDNSNNSSSRISIEDNNNCNICNANKISSKSNKK